MHNPSLQNKLPTASPITFGNMNFDVEMPPIFSRSNGHSRVRSGSKFDRNASAQNVQQLPQVAKPTVLSTNPITFGNLDFDVEIMTRSFTHSPVTQSCTKSDRNESAQNVQNMSDSTSDANSDLEFVHEIVQNNNDFAPICERVSQALCKYLKMKCSKHKQ